MDECMWFEYLKFKDVIFAPILVIYILVPIPSRTASICACKYKYVCMCEIEANLKAYMNL